MAFLMRVLSIIVVIAIAAFSRPTLAAGERVELYEYEIKAGLLYNFLKYTEWPESKTVGTSWKVCIFGDDPFHGTLQAIQERTVNKHPISLRTIHTLNDTADCHLLFLNAEEKAQWPGMVEFLNTHHVLTVSDFGSFITNGGIIEFGHSQNRIDVELNIASLQKAQLRVNDRLLKLVKLVGTTTEREQRR